jgi:hypothetical protein
MFRKIELLATVLALAALGSSMTAANATPSRHATTAIGAAVAQGRGCEAIPHLAAAIDEELPAAQLSAANLTKITVLRDLIRELSVNGKEGSARDVEEVAMSLLGYKKLWLRCGVGTFNWIKQAG